MRNKYVKHLLYGLLATICSLICFIATLENNVLSMVSFLTSAGGAIYTVIVAPILIICEAVRIKDMRSEALETAQKESEGQKDALKEQAAIIRRLEPEEQYIREEKRKARKEEKEARKKQEAELRAKQREERLEEREVKRQKAQKRREEAENGGREVGTLKVLAVIVGLIYLPLSIIFSLTKKYK